MENFTDTGLKRNTIGFSFILHLSNSYIILGIFTLSLSTSLMEMCHLRVYKPKNVLPKWCQCVDILCGEEEEDNNSIEPPLTDSFKIDD